MVQPRAPAMRPPRGLRRASSLPSAPNSQLLVGAIARDRLTPLDLAVAAGPVLCTHGQLIRRSHTFFRSAANRLALAPRFFAIARARDLFSGVQFSTASWICAAACAQLQLLGEPRPVARLAPTLV